METNDEVVERQKLVNDVETEEDPSSSQVTSSAPQSAPKSVHHEIQHDAMNPSPVTKPKIKSLSSEDTTRSQNSASCSIEQTVSDKGQTSARVTYINERRQKLLQEESRFEFKPKPRKNLKENFPRTKPNLTLNASNSDSFDDRPIKHHSFVSEVPDVKHMERALLGLLDDFHSGKLKAFGSGCTMEQMTKIREQQESLAKLHFELAVAEDDSLENNGTGNNAAKAQENMMQLVQRLEQLSVSIEQLQSSHSGL